MSPFTASTSLARTPTSYERAYVRRISALGLVIVALHLPALLLLAAVLHTGLAPVLLVMLLLLAGPAFAVFSGRTWEFGPDSLAVASMGVSALAIHVSGGLIEAHFEIFALIALLVAFGRARPVVIAAVLIAVHHIGFWLWLPASVFNYKAGFAIVLLHAFYVVLVAIASTWLAIQFGKSLRAQGIVLEHLDNSTAGIEGTTSHLEASSLSLADAALRSAASIADIATSAHQISSVSTSNLSNCTVASSIAAATALRFEVANRLLDDMVQAMDSINASSRKISSIVKTTEQIAFQTNILALNAAVEAARAGESGLGFAVVAEEVRGLAQRSAEAAQQTAQLIGQSIADTTAGREKVAEVTLAMRSISDESTRLRTIVADIHQATHSQAAGVARVTQAARSIESLSHTTAATAKQNSAAAADLTAQTHALRNIVFHLTGLSIALGETAAASSLTLPAPHSAYTPG